MLSNKEHTPYRSNWPKPLPWVVTIIVIIILSYLILQTVYHLGEIITPVFIPLLISGAIAYLLEPVVEYLEGFRLSRATATLLTLFLTILVTTLTLVFVLPNFWAQLSDMLARLPAAVQSAANGLRPKLSYLQSRNPLLYDKISHEISQFTQNPTAITEPVVNFIKGGILQLGSITASVLNLILIPMFVYYMLVDLRRVAEICRQAIPQRNQTTTSQLFRQVDGVLRSFVRGQLIVCTIMASLYVIGFLLLGLPMGFTLGVLSGFGHLVPYFGTASMAILAITFTALDNHPTWHLITVILMYPVVQSIEGFILTPKILGDKLELHPFIILVGVILGHHLFGILGIVLAAPVMACAKIFIGFFYQRYLESNFYQRPAPEDRGHVSSVSDA